MDYVNAALRRKIKQGRQYDKYFNGSDCKVSFLGKGDTDHTLDKMAIWSNKFVDHTKKLALGEFAGKPLERIVSEIHSFLYWHIQYKMDGMDQRLKSPSCAWATRNDGTDCKGYSIFASTILQNLGIKHYFKKVKQPFFEPDLWSHVYVIVPKDQKSLRAHSNLDYWVIDATILSNKEVSFTESNLRLMEKVSLPHYGLAAPGLGACSCTQKNRPMAVDSGTSTRYATGGTSSRSSLTRPLAYEAMKAAAPDQAYEIAQALNRFELFLADLVVNKNLPVHTANRAMERLRMFVEIGVEPTIKDLFAIPMTEKRAKGLGITAPLLTDINQLPSSTGIFRTTSSGRSSGSLLDTATSSIPLASTAKSLISAIIPKEVYDKTFGAIFANGFNLKCWGASRNPAKAEKDLAQYVPEMKNRAQQVLLTPVGSFEKAVNDYMVYAYGVDIKGRWWLEQGGARDCTRDGLLVMVGGLNNVIAEIIAGFKAHARAMGHELQETGKRTYTYPANKSIDQPVVNYQIPNFKLVLNKYQTTIPNNNISDSYVDPNNNLVINPDGSRGGRTSPLPQAQPQTAGFLGGDNFLKVALLAGGAIAIGAMFFKNDGPTIVSRTVKQK